MVHHVGGQHLSSNMHFTWLEKYYRNQLIMAKHPSTSLLRCYTLPSIGPYRMKVLCFKIKCRLDISCFDYYIDVHNEVQCCEEQAC